KDETLLPIYKISNQRLYLKELCIKGLNKRLNNDIPKEYMDRLEYELNVINDMGFNNYFLVVWDYVKYARKNNILMGARGSAASSIVSYSLGITDTDPLKYNLLFERFLNKERITMPDIDIDFDNAKREDVVNYLIDKYGKKSCLKIVTFSHLSSKQVIRDVAKVMDYESYKIDLITKEFDEKKDLLENKGKLNIKKLLEQDNKLDNIYNIAIRLEGLKRHYSIHAAGIVISNKELDNYIPLVLYSDGSYITGCSMNYLEDLGLLKMDILGLKTLSIIDNILNKVGNINFIDIDLNDKKTFDIFKEGLLEGIFQFETPGLKKVIMELKPNTIDDLIAVVALFRPGPMDNIPSYIKRKEHKEKIDYINDTLEGILKPTYGTIVYQEQIMQIANKMASYSMGEADILRRAMSKKKLDILEGEEEKFLTNSINNGYKKEEAKKVYDLILKFANYGFPKSHSVQYAVLGYKMAYLKANYPYEFMSILLTSSIGNVNKTKAFVNECKKMNITIEQPNINKSSLEYNILDNKIYYSLSMIKGIGTNLCKEILCERAKPFNDFFDFVSRMYEKIDKDALTNLIYANCFRDFGYNKKTLVENIDSAYNYAYLIKDTDKKLVMIPEIEVHDEYTKEELIEFEKNIFGYYLNNHPVTKYNTERNGINTSTLEQYFDKNIEIILNLEYKKSIDTKNNEKMMFVDASDEYGECELVVFPKQYITYFDIKVPAVYKVIGKVEKRLSKYQIIAYQIVKM
ncbi:MAG TPA: DNA polymerase III subunit alpha, partial [Bacilli bacterium]|nr:DNA polymerase III subunit alpha [Bacilli bacterium]